MPPFSPHLSLEERHRLFSHFDTLNLDFSSPRLSVSPLFAGAVSVVPRLSYHALRAALLEYRDMKKRGTWPPLPSPSPSPSQTPPLQAPSLEPLIQCVKDLTAAVTLLTEALSKDPTSANSPPSR